MENHQFIKSIIRFEGAISIAQFMNEALFNAKSGYYRIKEPIGSKADFITSPEISSIFGELIGVYFLSFILKSDKKISFVEMGAGLGTLAFDIISTFEKISKKLGFFDKLREKLSFNIVEISEKLSEIQQKKLCDSAFKINWFNDFDKFLQHNQNRQIYFVANELFDCFEIHQFTYSLKGWQEIMVGLKNDEFCLTLEKFNQQKHDLINKIALENNIKPQENIIFEHSFKAQNFMNKLSQSLQNQGGMAIIIDYGYEKSPLKSTLQALKNHERKNIFDNVGNCDLTALVNFQMLEKTAKINGLETSFLTQRDFLRSLKIEEKAQNDLQKAAINRLIDKAQMGELFKCLIFWKNEL